MENNEKTTHYNMTNLNIKFRFLIILVAVFAILGFAGFAKEPPAAFAEGAYVSDEVVVTAEFLQGMNGITPVFSTYPYEEGGDSYRKGVCAQFGVHAPYYRFVYTVDGENRAETQRFDTPADGLATFEADETGLFVVTCEVFADETGVVADSVSCTFKNDETAPYMTGEAVSEMSDWKRSGQEYVATIDWSVFNDAKSGLYGFRYFLRYDNGTTSDIMSVDFKNAEKSSVSVSEKAVLWLIVADTAGNTLEKSYKLDKFDNVAPPMPSYVVTPEPQEGVYAEKYEIRVTFLDDNAEGSGLSSVQKYRINGETRAFEAGVPTPESIILDKAADYRIQLFATDNAGNVSETREIVVPFSVFDVTPPYIGDVQFSFDLTNKDGICTLYADVTDSKESGVVAVYLEGTEVTLRPGASATFSTFITTFDCLSFGPTITLAARDALGHGSSVTMAFPYFTDVEINEALKRMVGAFRATSREEYAPAAWQALTNASTKVCNLLRSENATKADITIAINELAALFDENVKTVFVIRSAPDFASSHVTFTVPEEDIATLKKGSSVTVELSQGTATNKDYASEAGFGSGFSDFFDLVVKVDGEEPKEPFTVGLTLSMDLPNGYYDRRVALFDATTGKSVDTEIVNNKIVFNVKTSGKYALAIEGGKAPTGSNMENAESTTITVFGRTIDKTIFWWIIGGCGGGALLLIAVFVVLGKVIG